MTRWFTLFPLQRISLTWGLAIRRAGSRYFLYNEYPLPGVGVAIVMALVPVGVTPLGVIIEGVACGVP
jgi:cyanate permease